MGSFAGSKGHLTKISYSKANKIGLVGQQRAADVTQQLQTEFLETVFKYT